MLEYSMFERLPFRSQIEALTTHGTLLAQRRYNTWTVTLYVVNGAFVELWSGKEAEVISTFKKSANALDVLEPYVEGIDVVNYLDFNM